MAKSGKRHAILGVGPRNRIQISLALAQLLLQEGQYRQALVELEKVSGKKHPVELARVRAYYKLEEVEQALIHAKRAHALKASDESKGWIQYLSQLRTMEHSDQGIGHLTAR
eukprot:TRINITY_DN30769_c0_g1_i1.p1 TRINITY_DN30769_c0_g1~~TRINITY_DN30769_c0_g1_i1.p1  ORF type:complete len:112 (+),score=12.71 TRINITY_DN30769_c0_g1_i1:236-571(+)